MGRGLRFGDWAYAVKYDSEIYQSGQLIIKRDLLIKTSCVPVTRAKHQRARREAHTIRISKHGHVSFLDHPGMRLANMPVLFTMCDIDICSSIDTYCARRLHGCYALAFLLLLHISGDAPHIHSFPYGSGNVRKRPILRHVAENIGYEAEDGVDIGRVLQGVGQLKKYRGYLHGEIDDPLLSPPPTTPEGFEARLRYASMQRTERQREKFKAFASRRGWDQIVARME